MLVFNMPSGLLLSVTGRRGGLPGNGVAPGECAGPQGKPACGHSDKEQELEWHPLAERTTTKFFLNFLSKYNLSEMPIRKVQKKYRFNFEQS